MSSADATSSSAPSRLSRSSFFILITGLLANAIGQAFIFAILPPLGREVALSEVQTTSIISTSALVFTFCSPWWGRRSDQIGRKIVIVIGLTGYAVGTVIFAGVFALGMKGILSGWTLYFTALFFRCLQSSVMAATSPGVTAYAADHSSRAFRTQTLARLGTANSLGVIIGPVLAGLLAGLGLLFPLYVAALFTLIAVFTVWKYLPEGEFSGIARKRAPRLSFLDSRLRVYLLSAIGTFTGFSAIQQTLGFRIQDSLSLSGVETAQYTGAALMVSAFFTLALQLSIAQRYAGPALNLVRMGLVCNLIAASFVASAQGLTGLIIGMAFMGAGLGLIGPAIAAGASLAVSRDEQGGAAGLITACPAAGFVIGPILGGALYQLNAAYPPIFAGIITFCVLLYALKSRVINIAPDD
jgi:MFS family permease